MRETIARDLLAINAVFLRPDQPFTWASGIQSPIYCDNRLTLSVPEVRARIEKAIANRISERFHECDLLIGMATAGIAHAAIVAHLLGLPMGYVRSSAKDHGRGNRIEGAVTPGMKAVVVEDLISTGGSVMESVAVLREAGAEVLGVVCIFTYKMARALEHFNAERVCVESLTDFDTLTEVAAIDGIIASADVARLRAFRDHPDDPSWMKIL
ncbi:MAG: orotate phosphoribosyltransferase [Oscillospiraceae bacterium]|nr:orotate phosphoribosyltransferase [Oscillospiraceae bacterium]